MSRLMIKVCGMRDSWNIREVAGLRPELMGFIFYPESPRYAGEYPAEGMISSFPGGIIKTGVFVDAELKDIKARILRFGLQAVQLHGNESPEMCKQIMETGIKVIKVFKPGENTDFSKMKPFVSCSNWFLFDTATKIPGGSGVSFNWKVLEKYDLGHPFFLSGGIGPEDAERIPGLKNPALIGVDINSKFEIEAGVKDVEKVRKFMVKIRTN